jgi:hypothetical protein
MMVREAIYATVFSLFVLFAFLCLVMWFKRKKRCVVCGDPARGDFCCEGCENLHYDEEELNRDDEDDEQEELERQERISKALP